MRAIDADAFVRKIRKQCCEDCVRRKGIKNGKMQYLYEIGGVPCRACEIEDMLNEVEDAPPIQPEPKMGKWIPVTRIEEWSKEEGLTGFPPEVAEFPNCTIKYVDATEPDEVDAVKCSECGTVFDFTDARNWCSECGADMRGEQDE